MADNTLYSIKDVCRMLGTTSRTLRFYEEKGIISSCRNAFSSLRYYNEQQINHIKNVMVLRTIGLSVESIARLQKEGADLKNEILSKKAEIYALIDSKSKEISLLNEALAIVENGDSLFGKDFTEQLNLPTDYNDIVKNCSKAIVTGDFELLYSYFSNKLAEYEPIEAFRCVCEDVLIPCGKLVAYEKTVRDECFPNIVFQYMKYSKIGLKIKFVFHNYKIDGLWLNYYECNKKDI